ncbi:MAG: Gfo/Idh/MocA family oxidoreductase [Bacteroidota bacterium]
MQQLTQQLKSGQMEIMEVPFPSLGDNEIMVRNHYSVISAGTEGKNVSDARKGYIAKAKSRQKEVKMVIEMIKSQGFKETYDFVMNKLEAASPLGYSCAGEVIAVGNNIKSIAVGDRVACGGDGAFHADVVVVTENLCVKIKDNVSFKHAAFATIAAIAIQGIRQAELNFGSNCTIIGLGLIGQLTIQILKASGIHSIGIDINQEQVNAAKLCGADLALNRNDLGLEQLINTYTDGFGTDAVIITAGSSSLDPVELAGILCRKKGKVVIVGAVPTGFSRANYYKKELDLKMAMSYGPGRYDINYEEKGIDYPIGYVRFTEQRNMKTFVDFIAEDKLNLDLIVTHEFELQDAEKAYDMILAKNEPFSGIVIKYDQESILQKVVIKERTAKNTSKPRVGLIGAGNFAQGTLLPRMKDLCEIVGVATATGNQSKYVSNKYNIPYCFDGGERLIECEDINTVFITTRHNLHAKYIIESLKAGKHVFVEKPLAMTINELEEIHSVYEELNAKSKNLLMVGFNRRFAPAIQKIKTMFNDNQQKSINIRINAGAVPAEHWVNDPVLGGGRMIGEGCHFIDLAMFLAGGLITSVSAESFTGASNLQDTMVVSLRFENGSIANLSYFSNGNKALPKEYIEVFCGGAVAIIDDFKSLTLYGKNKSKIKLKGQDKGHSNELKTFLNAIEKGDSNPIPFNESYHSTLVTFKVLESLRENRKILI